MSSSSSSTPTRRQQLVDRLLPRLHPDVIPIVLGYEATIQFEVIKTCPTPLLEDVQLASPHGLVLSETTNELFVLDTYHYQIQVFHQGTGRFLRKWGQQGYGDGQFSFPLAAAISSGTETDHSGEELFVVDARRRDVQVFRLSDSHFLRCLRMTESSGEPKGIALVGGDMFISRNEPSQIDIMRQSDGKRKRILDCCRQDDGVFEESFLNKLFVDEEANELFLADSSNAHIKVLDLISGKFLRQYGNFSESRPSPYRVFWPRACVAHGEEVIVCDHHNHRLVVFNRLSCQMVPVIQEKVGGVILKSLVPSDIAVNCRDELFVCDHGNSKVWIFR